MKPREHILIAVAVVGDAGSLPDENPPSYLFLWRNISIVLLSVSMRQEEEEDI
jgi:hypothetical protein